MNSNQERAVFLPILHQDKLGMFKWKQYQGETIKEYVVQYPNKYTNLGDSE